MQGPPPTVSMASPFSSPPIKKQRASGTPLQPMVMMMQPGPPPRQQQQPPAHQQDPTRTDGASTSSSSSSAAISHKRAQLLKLAQTNQRNQPSASSLMDQARTSLMAAPPIAAAGVAAGSGPAQHLPPTKLTVPGSGANSFRRTTGESAAATPVMNGTSNTHSNGGGANGTDQYGTTTNRHVNHFGAMPPSRTTTIMGRPPGSALRGGGRPSPPPPTPPHPENSLPPQSPKPAAIILNPSFPPPTSPRLLMSGAPPVRSPGSTVTTTDARLARRLGMEFANQSSASSNAIPTPTRSKSAPPSRKAPPPPPPPPRAKEEPASSKTVSFQSPEDTTRHPETPELTKEGVDGPPVTPTGNNHISNAGATPAPSRNHAGSTPFPRAFLATPTTHDKQALLRGLQDIADTPRATATTPESTTTSPATTTTTTTPTRTDADAPSPELRMQQQLASSNKEKAEALKKVSQLEGQLAQSKLMQVRFLSPTLGSKADPKRYTKSPTPKRLAGRFNNGSSAPADDPAVLQAAAASIPYEFSRDDRTYVVRRPYGRADEKEFWLKFGHLPAKVYDRQANLDDETSLEVAANCDDGSVLNLYGGHFVRHHTVDEGPNEYEDQSLTTFLGNVAYVDDNGVDQQYSLDDVWGTAMEVRGLYRASLRAAVDALLLAPAPKLSPSSSIPVDHVPAPATAKATVDTGTTTDPLPKPNPVQQAPPPMDDEPDAIATAFRFCFHVVFSFIFFSIKTIWQCLIGTLYCAFIFVVVSLLYLHLQDDNGADEMGAIVTVYKNAGGLV